MIRGLLSPVDELDDIKDFAVNAYLIYNIVCH